MKTRNRLVLAGSLILGLFVTESHADPMTEEAAQFNQAIVQTKKDLYASGREYGLKLGRALVSGKPEDIAAMKKAYDDALLAAKKQGEDWKKRQPLPSRSGKELYAF